MSKQPKVYITEKELDKYIMNYYKSLETLGIPEEQWDELLTKHLKTKVVFKYSKEWQDRNLQDWCELILNVPGGYWQAIEAMQQPHLEYEHYKHKYKMSYEKGNVSSKRAKIELQEPDAELFMIFQSNKEEDGIMEVELSANITIQSPQEPKHL